MTEAFLWGVTSPAHQVEGHNIHNDWWAWERTQSRLQPSGAAADHWNRWREDIALAQQLGLTAYRFSIEWSRIEPQESYFNRQAVDHYREVAATAQRLGMEPFVTLWDVTLPAWLAETHGWGNSQALAFFERYVRFVAQHMGETVRHWVPVNDPVNYVDKAYVQSIWPPHQTSWWQAFSILSTLLKAQQLTYKILHRLDRSARVGTASQVFQNGLPRFLFWYWMHATHRRADFVGLNYLDQPAEGLALALHTMQHYQLPVYVTELGVNTQLTSADGFLRSSLRIIEETQRRGVDVRGCFYKPFLDGFEWEKRYERADGLIAVDFATQQRTLRPAAYTYQAIIQTAHQGKA